MASPAQRRAGAREWAGLAVLALPTALLGLDVTVLYLAFPALAAALQPSSTQALWIMDAYGFLIAGFLITMGTLGDRIGRKRLLMIGAVAFGIASILAAYSTSAGMLIAMRALLGLAGAALMPSTLALISNMFLDARQRALAVGIWATMFALGMAAGPLVGGALLAHFWWGSAFLVAVPVVALLLLAAPTLLPEYRAPQYGRFDLPSVALSLAAMLPVIYGIKQATKHGPTAGALLALVFGAVFAWIFVRRQYRLDNPLLDMRLFASRTFCAALGVLLIGLVGVGGVMLLVTQYLQLVVGLSPLAAGLWMGPPALMMFVAAIAAPLIARYIRPGLIMAGTLALSVIGYLLLARLTASSGPLPAVVGFSIVYLGLGAIAALGTDLVVGAAPKEKAGSAAAVSETVQELGIALGVAVLGSLTSAVYRYRITLHGSSDLPEEISQAVGDSLWSAVSVASHIPGDVLDQARQAFVTGFNFAASISAAGIMILAIVAAVSLRRIAAMGGEPGN